MYVMLLVMLCMLVMMVIIRIIANSLTKRRLISMFDFRLANGKSEITGEYRDAIQEKDIDEQVIDDLEMREVFARVDFTYSDVGREYMYGKFFVNPTHHELLENTIARLDDQTTLAQSIYALYQLSRQYSESLKLLEHEDIFSFIDRIVIVTLMLIPFLLFGFYFVVGIDILLFVGFYFATMMTTYAYYKHKTEHLMSEVLSYCYLVECLDQLMKAHVYALEDQHKIAKMVKRVKKYTLITQMFHQLEKIDAFYFMEIIKGMFMIPVFQCLILFKHKEELAQDVLEAYEYVGCVDMAISVMTLRKRYETCIPELSSTPIIAFEDGYHPLLENPVKNSFSSDQSCIITGSNASGKSTFIKMIGVNTLLAKSLHTCFASQWQYYPYHVCSAIHMKDDLESGESYFVKEVKTLKKIIDMSTAHRCLIFIDEILRGTNEKERVAISYAILKYLFESSSQVFITTHDLSIIKAFADIQKYCFNDYVKDGQLCCDYKIHDGVCQVGNAIALLSVYDYPQGIIDTLKKPD